MGIDRRTKAGHLVAETAAADRVMCGWQQASCAVHVPVRGLGGDAAAHASSAWRGAVVALRRHLPDLPAPGGHSDAAATPGDGCSAQTPHLVVTSPQRPPAARFLRGEASHRARRRAHLMPPQTASGHQQSLCGALRHRTATAEVAAHLLLAPPSLSPLLAGRPWPYCAQRATHGLPERRGGARTIGGAADGIPRRLGAARGEDRSHVWRSAAGATVGATAGMAFGGPAQRPGRPGRGFWPTASGEARKAVRWK
eukprot:COSAG01_NODE_20322_length_959_cov_136.095349_2_plen_253_part_01